MTPDELKEARGKLPPFPLSQRGLAKALDVNPTAVFAWETGRKPISLRTAMSVSLLLMAEEHKDVAREVARLHERAGIPAANAE